MSERRISLVMVKTDSERVILRVEFENEPEFHAYVYESLERLERVLEMTGLPCSLDRDGPGSFTEFSAHQLLDLVEYSDGAHLCEPELCYCSRHTAA